MQPKVETDYRPQLNPEAIAQLRQKMRGILRSGNGALSQDQVYAIVRYCHYRFLSVAAGTNEERVAAFQKAIDPCLSEMYHVDPAGLLDERFNNIEAAIVSLK